LNTRVSKDLCSDKSTKQVFSSAEQCHPGRTERYDTFHTWYVSEYVLWVSRMWYTVEWNC